MGHCFTLNLQSVRPQGSTAVLSLQKIIHVFSTNQLEGLLGVWVVTNIPENAGSVVVNIALI